MNANQPQVLNRRSKPDETGAIYVGRPSPWGNPAIISHTLTRKAACTSYQSLAIDRTLTDGPAWLEPLRGHHLVCWCAPEPCHATVLIRLANAPDPVELARTWRAQLDQRATHTTVQPEQPLPPDKKWARKWRRAEDRTRLNAQADTVDEQRRRSVIAQGGGLAAHMAALAAQNRTTPATTCTARDGSAHNFEDSAPLQRSLGEPLLDTAGNYTGSIGPDFTHDAATGTTRCTRPWWDREWTWVPTGEHPTDPDERLGRAAHLAHRPLDLEIDRRTTNAGTTR